MKHGFIGAACAVFVASLAGGVHAQDSTFSATGSAPVTRDTDSVRAAAEGAARRELVLAVARQVLGAERLGELSPELVARLADQIRPEFITDRRSERIGSDYRTTLVASIDRAWFQALLDDEGIRSSGTVAGARQQRILVLLDEAVGPARDYDRAESVTIEYDRDTGSSYSDQSSAAYREREAAAAASRRSGVVVSQGGYADAWGVGGYRRGAAYGTADASAYGRDEQYSRQTDVEAQSHDIVRFRYSETFQVSASSGFGHAAIAAMTSELRDYDIATSNPAPVLASFAPGPPPLYTELQASGRLSPFFAHASAQADAPFFMGGILRIQDAGRHPATNEATCTGELVVQVYATATAEDVAADTANASTAGDTYENCAARLSEQLAAQAIEVVGPQIQRYWRARTRDVGAAVETAQAGGEYMLVVRGDLSLGAQADLMDAIASTPGVASHAFIEQAPGQMSVQVSYAGATPLHLALYQRLRNNPAFAALDARTAGRTVTLCLGGC